MARSHARLSLTLWNDDDFIDLSAGAQRMYMLLLSQPNVGYAGMLPLTVKRWAKRAKNTTPEQVDGWLAELEVALYIVMDEDTDELLIRTFMRNDEVWKQPNVMVSAARDATATASRRIRRHLATEAARMASFPDLKRGSKEALDDLIEALPEPFPMVDGKPSENPTANPSGDPSAYPRGRGSVTQVSTGSPPPLPSPTTAPTTSAAKPPGAELVPIRRDVETLCQTLAELMIRNGCKPPTITDRWRDAARLLLDRDGVSLNDAMSVLGWSQSDEFWRANVLSMPTFRDKYDQLRMQATRGSGSSDAKTRGHIDLIERLAQENR